MPLYLVCRYTYLLPTTYCARARARRYRCGPPSSPRCRCVYGGGRQPPEAQALALCEPPRVASDREPRPHSLAALQGDDVTYAPLAAAPPRARVLRTALLQRFNTLLAKHLALVHTGSVRGCGVVRGCSVARGVAPTPRAHTGASRENAFACDTP